MTEETPRGAEETSAEPTGPDTRAEWHPPERNSGVQLAKPKAKWYQWFLPRSAREHSAKGLQKAADTSDLLHAVTIHLERQAQVQERLLSALERLPEAIDGMRSVGKSAEQQTEVLGEVRKQLESSVAGMVHFEQALNTMDATNKTAADTVASLVERSRESEAKLRELVNRSERRVTLLLGILGLGFLTLVGGALYYGVSGKPFPFGQVPQSPTIAPEPAPSSVEPEVAVAAEESVEAVVEEAPVVEIPAEEAVAEEVAAEEIAEEPVVVSEEPAAEILPEPTAPEGMEPETPAELDVSVPESVPEPAVESPPEVVPEPAEAPQVESPVEPAVEVPPEAVQEPVAGMNAEPAPPAVEPEPASEVLQTESAPSGSEEEGSIILRVIETLRPAAE